MREIIKSVSLRLARDDFENYEETCKQEVVPTEPSPVITSNGEELAFENAQFGFEKWDGKGVIVNARAETVNQKSMFKDYVNNGRCVVPVSGYYEWKQPDEGQKKKIKHHIKDRQGNLLFMAGLWRDGKDGREFIIITKNPVGDIVNIHNRMPVMLRTDQLEAWLNGTMPIEELSLLDYDCFGVPLEEPEKEEPEGNEQMSLF